MNAQADVPAVVTREQFAALIESCKAANLPESMGWKARERAALVVKRAQGWLRSSFFRIESSETQQHVAALHAARRESRA